MVPSWQTSCADHYEWGKECERIIVRFDSEYEELPEVSPKPSYSFDRPNTHLPPNGRQGDFRV